MIPQRSPFGRVRERGYVTLFLLGLAAAIFLALGAALQTNASLRECNKRQERQLQTRAAAVVVVR